MIPGHFESGDEDSKSLELNKVKNHTNVFHVYSSVDDLKCAGIFKGGLDIGVDPT
jgi:hypothetical protein